MANDRKKLVSLYQTIDGMFKQSKFDQVDQQLRDLDICSTSSKMLVGYLIATHVEMTKLPAYTSFFQKVHDALVSRHVEPTDVLNGLEPEGFTY